ncbi:MAG TPA: AAA family ATPase [Solirubrobacteraceae bacterium]|jgi:DNA-binding SARP family transcriptional activator
MLRIRVLGGLALEVDGQPRPLPETARGRALLAFCALNLGSHPRARLAAALRPDVLDRSARATLRQAIWALRQAVGEDGDGGAIVADRDRFGLREDAVRVDVLELRALAEAGETAAALELAGGELLPELDDEWAVAARGAHHDEVGELLVRRAEEAAAAGDVASAVACARRALEHDPRSERAARTLMTRLAEAGDRPAALATYRTLGDRLRRELGVAPSPATRELAERIRAGEVFEPPAAEAREGGGGAVRSGGAGAVRSGGGGAVRSRGVGALRSGGAGATPPGGAGEARSGGADEAPLRIALPARLREAPRAPFVGREAAMARLRAAWDGAAAGARRLVEVWGDPGIGKTRLARELAVEAHERGAIVLLGAAEEDPLSPFQPFVEALTHVCRELSDEELAAIAGPSARDLARLVPALGDRLPDRDGAADGDDRLRLFEAVAQVLGALSRHAPVLFLIDDAHWADDPTLKLLRHLLRSARGPERILLLLTCRTGTAAPVRVEREINVERIRLQGLGPEEAHELLTATGCLVDDQERAQIVERTEGNPFFLELFGDADGGAIPVGVKEAIEQRVAGLSDEAREVLVLAAVAGQAFDVTVLEGAARWDVLAAVDEAVEAGVVEEDAEVFGRYRFRHALVRDVLYQEPSRVRRSRMHVHIARALEQRGGREAEVAHHLLAALPSGDALRAVTAAARAARRAGSMLAHEEAATLYRRALAAQPEGGLPDADRAEILIGLGEAEQRAGARDSARPALEEAAALAAKLDDGTLLARAALAHGGVGVVIAAPDPVTVRLLRDALALLDQDDPLRARVLARLSIELYYADRDEAEALSANAVALARRQREPAALAAALSARRVALWTPHHSEERLAVAAEMEENALRAGDREQALQAHNWLIVDLLELGEVAGVDAAIDDYERAAAEVGLPNYAWYVPLWRSMRAAMDGRWDAAQALAIEARDVGRRAQDANADLFWTIQEAHILIERGRFEEIDIARVQRDVAARDDLAWVPWLAMLLAERGEAGEATALLERLAPDRFAVVEEDVNWHTLTELAEAVVGVGHVEWAAQVYERLLPHARLQAVVARAVATYGPASYFLGRLAATCGRWEEADAHFAAAIAANERIGAAPRLALAQEQRALVLRRRGAADRADALLAEARAAYGRLGISRNDRGIGGSPLTADQIGRLPS